MGRRLWTQDEEGRGPCTPPLKVWAGGPLFQIILPWLTMSEKVQEQTRALSTMAHMLRFICNFPHLLVSAGWGWAAGGVPDWPAGGSRGRTEGAQSTSFPALTLSALLRDIALGLGGSDWPTELSLGGGPGPP